MSPSQMCMPKAPSMFLQWWPLDVLYWFCFFNQSEVQASWFMGNDHFVWFQILCCTFSLHPFTSSSSLFAWTEHSSFFTPVHCKQPRGKCSLSSSLDPLSTVHIAGTLILLVSHCLEPKRDDENCPWFSQIVFGLRNYSFQSTLS